MAGLIRYGTGNLTRPRPPVVRATFLGTAAAADPPTYPERVLVDTPEAYYRLNAAVADSSGHGHGSASFTGSPTFTTGLIGGDTDQAMQLDGVTASQGMTVALAGWFVGFTSPSLEAIIYPETLTGTHTIVDNDDGGTNRAFQFRTNGSNIEFVWWTSDNVQHTVTGSTALVLNARNHVAASYNEVTGVATVCVEGVSAGTTTITPLDARNGCADLRIGYSSGGAQQFKGRIDEVAWYSHVVSGARFAAHVAVMGALLVQVTATRSTTWNTKAQATTTRATTWDALARTTATRATTWDTLAAVTATRATTYDVLARATATRATTWDALAPVTATRATTWDVLTRVTATRATTWNVLGSLAQVTATRATTWRVLGPVTATRATTWDVLARATATRATTWDVLTATTATRATTWRVLARTTATRATTWNVASTLAQVTTTRSTTWRVLARTTATRATTWDALARTTATRSTTWDVLIRVTATRATTWDVLARVTATRATTWDVRVQVTATRATTWNVLAVVVSGTVTLTGDLTDFIVVTPIRNVRAYLIPTLQAKVVGTVVHLGGLKLVLTTALTFTVTGLPTGSYRLRSDYWSTDDHRAGVLLTPEFVVTADSDLAALLP